ncbi:hypothetical protein TPHA_0B01600 [Tetrapisispora phaffii CBS 4417]|uniref:FK506-binding protein n=1 Tax=Tetrapisispora phaffii (strain ATCC 24235 / CBS 4417 / NBRC 1672 / NRRL Y-8282 / UCD 70-5) TaxID=1071381 RepID=G8BPA2_TETPH|nr:hypothetical protein TPHA_0B01600 [Tetrapisispora phaffii CBS 4417]CCE61833.1 hypothetical protein TPHA_0B01600 [Tetrapisispora phaffii CBS 4417]
MADMLPLATYSLNVEPFTPTPAIDVNTPVTIRITMAALNPDSYDDEKKPSTLRIIKRNPDFDDEDDDILGDYDDEEIDNEDDEDEEEEEEEPMTAEETMKKLAEVKKSKNAKKQSKKDEAEEEEEEVEEEEDDDYDEDDEDDEFHEYILLTLSPDSAYQQTLDLTIAPEEDVQFVVTGSYAISLTGNFVKHPFDTPMVDFDDFDEEDIYGDDSSDDDDYDLTPDEDEIIDDELDDLEDASDVEGRIEELVAEEETQKKGKDKKDKKRKQEEETKKEAKKAKKVEFKKDLEEGPTKKKEEPKKPKTKVLEGGIIIEDRKTGTGPLAKRSSKIGMRYIGKLKNGKVFDKNTSGKPFNFKLGHGEVIKGWDIGVAGMAVGGERRIVIPAAYAYGKQALPGIPANSELTFDVKLVSMK